jgi:hypothetical protein
MGEHHVRVVLDGDRVVAVMPAAAPAPDTDKSPSGSAHDDRGKGRQERLDNS